MRLDKFVLYIADTNYEQSVEDLKANIENGLSDQILHFGEVESVEIGEWDDDNFWNFNNHRKSTLDAEFQRMKALAAKSNERIATN